MTGLKIQRTEALNAAMAKFDWAIAINKELMARPDNYSIAGLTAAQIENLKAGHERIFAALDEIKTFIRNDIEKTLESVQPCQDGAPKRVMFAGPLGSEATDLMNACAESHVPEKFPAEVKSIVASAQNAVIINMDALRKKLPMFDALYREDPAIASQIVRPIVSSWTHALYEAAGKMDANIWSNESMASGVYKNKDWLDKNLAPLPIHAVVVLPPAKRRIENLQTNAQTLSEKTGASIRPEEVLSSLETTQETALPNMVNYQKPGCIISGNMHLGFDLAAINSPAAGAVAGQSSLKLLRPEELPGFAVPGIEGEQAEKTTKKQAVRGVRD